MQQHKRRSKVPLQFAILGLMHKENGPTVELVIFCPKAEELLGTPVCSHCFTSWNRIIPTKRITDLYGREFIPCISLSRSSLETKDIRYHWLVPFLVSQTFNGISTGFLKSFLRCTLHCQISVYFVSQFQRTNMAMYP
ncbi:hypothetical protein BS78_10G206400 [Paspalum vaginatum]|nr:hypothetical protein BS78_10G206400 [Paspalum vaginatum]KAJ1260101.1 hypothetical protein BS78_10G206400 [Paspalum vaginatum]